MTTNAEWQISYCAGYIVPPCKGLEEDEALERIQGSPVGLHEEVIGYFSPLFKASNDTCKIQISFAPTNGLQVNAVRDQMRKLAFGSINEKIEASKNLAVRLALATDNRSETGLFVIVTGSLNTEERVALFKFDTDESLQATFQREGLSIRVVEGAFSRKSEYFKAAVFQDQNAETTFWHGKVEDKQANQKIYGVSDLWAIHFLQSRPFVTGPRGTMIVAKALRHIIDKERDPSIQHALVSAATTLKSQQDRPIQLKEIAEKYLPTEAREPFLKAIGKQLLADTIIEIDEEVLDKQLRFRTLILDNQFSVTFPAELYDDPNYITMVPLPPIPGETVEITIRGRLVGEKLRSQR